MGKIECLICGRKFDFLPPHLRKTHGVSVDDYREEFDIPAGFALASLSYRQLHSEKIRRMQKTGVLDYSHLPTATAKARTAGRGGKTRADTKKHLEKIMQVRPWATNQLAPGAKRADGRDADRTRQYQRDYRDKKRRERN